MRDFVYPPSDPLIGEGVRLLARRQWEAWQRARAEEQKVLPGNAERPGKTHPDVGKQYAALPPHIVDFGIALTWGRVMQFARMERGDVEALIQSGQPGGNELPSDLIEEIAQGFHQSWWLLRQCWGLQGHSGDKAWEDETPAEQENDLVLVGAWAKLLHDAEKEVENPALQAVLKFLRGEEAP